MFLKKTYLILLSFLLFIPLSVKAYSDYIYASGENIGIEIKSNGVLVVGTYVIDNINPASDAGLKIGDIITSIDDKTVSSVKELTNIIESKLDTIKIGYIRNDITGYTNLKLYKDNLKPKTGLYVKDSITGIGTLTFIDPNTLLFGALGHEIIEKNTGLLFKSNKGTIFESEVINITKSNNGIPGEKNARYNVNNPYGNISENTIQGIFGKYTKNINSNLKLYKVATINEIKLGKAKILTVLNDDLVKEYNINITKINKNSKIKNIVFEITDQNLLNITGGIIQGMSGSPIIQNEYIVGAVTHVVVNDVTKGYGISITNMLEEAEN